MEHTYTTRGTCSRQITFELDGNRVKNIHFVGGCDGNLKAVRHDRGADRVHAAGQHLRPPPHLLRRSARHRSAAGV